MIINCVASCSCLASQGYKLTRLGTADFYAKRLFKPKESCQQKSCELNYKEEELLVRQIK